MRIEEKRRDEKLAKTVSANQAFFSWYLGVRDIGEGKLQYLLFFIHIHV